MTLPKHLRPSEVAPPAGRVTWDAIAELSHLMNALDGNTESVIKRAKQSARAYLDAHSPNWRNRS